MHTKFGYVRVTTAAPKVVVGNPAKNAEEMIRFVEDHEDSDIIVFPELATTGYTCGDLFRSRTLLDASDYAILKLRDSTNDLKRMIVFGAPIRVGPDLFNCMVFCAGGKVVGIVPKQNIPGYAEFYEPRYFAAANGSEPKMVGLMGGPGIAPFGIDLMFRHSVLGELLIFGEICEDLWMPVPPSSIAALHGANLILNVSASPEKVATDEYRMELVRNQSGRSIAAYAYASAGPSESTGDLVFSGHCIITENGSTLAESSHIGDGTLAFTKVGFATADIDVQRLNTERRIQRSFGDQMRRFPKEYRIIEVGWFSQQGVRKGTPSLVRKVPAFPFVPSNPETLAKRCAAVFDIQCAGLAKRLTELNYPTINIGVSGGLDSTHALLVAHKTLTALGKPASLIHGVTMPGFGTTKQTKGIAHTLMKELGVKVTEIDIRPACLQMFRDIGHKPFGIDPNVPLDEFMVKLRERMLTGEPMEDLTFENVQAGQRTSILFRMGFTLGTGDMSELALGWCTYGVGDQMAHYNVNAGVPKTLISFLIKYVANNHYPAGTLRDALIECSGLTISPELLPLDKDGNVVQSTEGKLGPYALHDFALFHFQRYGFTPDKILYLMGNVPEFRGMKLAQTLETFFKRFFSQQYKRDAMPNGPKVGSVALSPRGDWRMPPDADPSAWLSGLTNARGVD